MKKKKSITENIFLLFSKEEKEDNISNILSLVWL